MKISILMRFLQLLILIIASICFYNNTSLYLTTALGFLIAALPTDQKISIFEYMCGFFSIVFFAYYITGGVS